MTDAAKILLTEGDAPGTPASGQVALYCKVDHEYYYKDSTGTEHSLIGATGPAGTGITWQGTWSDAVEYVANDAVEYSGSAYVANATSTNKVPGVDAEWDVFASKGDKGDTGAGITAESVGFTITGGTTPKTLTIALDANVSGTNTGDQTLSDATIATTDITTNDASTAKHGFVVKATAPAATLRNIVGIDNAETAYTNKALFDTTDPSTQAYSDTAAVGSAMTAARRDHKHAMPAAYSHPTGDGNLHIPANSTTNSGKVLTAGADAGTYTWETPGSSASLSRLNKTHADSPYTVTAANCNGLVVLTNTGATASLTMLLPAGADGLRVPAIVTAAYDFIFVANGTEMIRYLSTVSKAGGSIKSASIGDELVLDWNGTQWVANVNGLSSWWLETS